MRGISWLAEVLSASQDGLSSMDLVSLLVSLFVRQDVTSSNPNRDTSYNETSWFYAVPPNKGQNNNYHKSSHENLLTFLSNSLFAIIQSFIAIRKYKQSDWTNCKQIKILWSSTNNAMGRKEMGYVARMRLIIKTGNISVRNLERMITFRYWGIDARLIRI
jgi:hypothetical protein